MIDVGALRIRDFAFAARGNERPRDAELVAVLARAAEGDGDALGAIYDALAAEIFAVALWRTGSQADAADVVQDVFVKIASSAASLVAIRHPRRYLLALAYAGAVDRQRARRPDVRIEDAPFLEAASLDAGRAIDAERASRALAEIPGPQRVAVYLHHFRELSFREIGRITGVPTFTAASRYRLGIARLRARLEGAR